MAIIQVSSAPSREVYDAVERTVDLSGARPEGMIVHAAAEQANGTVVIVDLWESGTAIDAFEQGRLFPVFASMPDAPIPESPSRQLAFHVVRE